jgi:hypothetical protein
MKRLPALLLLLAPLFADLPAPADTRAVRVQSLSPVEIQETILQAGRLIYNEADPSQLRIGDGATPGGLIVTPPTPPWDHSATQDIRLNGYRLHLGNGFSLISLGSYAALSGDGEFSAAPGQSAWSVNAVDIIRILGAESLLNIDSFTWDSAESQFVLTVNVGADPAVPTVQQATDLIAQDWTDIEPASITEPDNGIRTIRVDYDGESPLLFFRVVMPSGEAEIQLRATTAITGDLTVTGSIPRESDIDDGVTAHGWGDHAQAGYTQIALDGTPPATSSSPGEPGTLIQSGNYLYICIAQDTWRRVTLLDWE